MTEITRYADLVGWMSFTTAMAIVTLTPERMWWAIPPYVIAGVLFVFSIVKKRSGTNVR